MAWKFGNRWVLVFVGLLRQNVEPSLIYIRGSCCCMRRPRIIVRDDITFKAHATSSRPPGNQPWIEGCLVDELNIAITTLEAIITYRRH